MNTVLTIEGATSNGDNYIAWAPVRASIRLVDAGNVPGPVRVVLRNRNSTQGGKVVFLSARTGPKRNQLQLNLPVDGNPVDFFVAGRFGRPSTADKDAVIEVLQAGTPAGTPNVLSTTALMVRIRKNANQLRTGERNRFLSALAQLNNSGIGPFSDFPDVHSEDGVREAHRNYGFLPWHRAFLLDLERELQRVDASVALPYWKFDEVARKVFSAAFMGFTQSGASMVTLDPSNPIAGWTTVTQGIPRIPFFNQRTQSPMVLSDQQTLDLGDPGDLFANFSRQPSNINPQLMGIEFNPHGDAHNHFAGDISGISTAARDPLFFLLHCNVDRLWAKWQTVNRRFDVTNPASYPFLGSAGSPGAIRAGHNLGDDMWPWNGITGTGGNQRPPTAPGGPFPGSAVTAAPGPTPTVRSMIDYQGVFDPADYLGFGYDDVEYVF